MAEGKDKHECNKKLIDEGNKKKEQESKIFLKKRIIRRISQLSEWNVWWIEGTVRQGESREWQATQRDFKLKTSREFSETVKGAS